MGAVFEPSVLLGLDRTQKLMTSKPLTHLSCIFWCGIRAIQGRKEPDLNDISTGTSSTKLSDEISITEITQSLNREAQKVHLLGLNWLLA